MYIITLFSNQSLSIYKGLLEPWAYVRFHNNLYSNWFGRFGFYLIQKEPEKLSTKYEYKDTKIEFE